MWSDEVAAEAISNEDDFGEGQFIRFKCSLNEITQCFNAQRDMLVRNIRVQKVNSSRLLLKSFMSLQSLLTNHLLLRIFIDEEVYMYMYFQTDLVRFGCSFPSEESFSEADSRHEDVSCLVRIEATA